MKTARARMVRFKSSLAVLPLSLALLACGSDPESSASESDWSSYGRDYANTRTNPVETTIGKANVAQLVEKWRFSEGAVTGTPVHFDGKVYFGDWNSIMHARDAETGAEIWRTTVMGAEPQAQINSTPFVTEDTVYLGSEGGVVTALDRKSGALKWSNKIDNHTGLMLWSSPIVVGDLLIIGVGSFQVFLPDTPPFRGSVVGVNTKDGSVRWQRFLTEGSGVSVWSSAAIDEEQKLAIIGTGQEYTKGASTPYSDALVAINYETGNIVWHKQFTAGDKFQVDSDMDNEGPDHDVGAAPNLFEVNGRKMVGVGDKGGRYFGLDRTTGELLWTRELTPGGANGGIMASTAYHDGVIYIASNDGTTGGEAGVGGGPSACVIFALNAADGSVKWQVPSMPGVFGALAVANEVLYVPTLAGELRAYDIANGAKLWTGVLDKTLSMGGGVTIADGRVFAGYGWTWLPVLPVPGGLVAYGLP